MPADPLATSNVSVLEPAIVYFCEPAKLTVPTVRPPSSVIVAGAVMTVPKLAIAPAPSGTPPFQFAALDHTPLPLTAHVLDPPPTGCGGTKFASGVIAMLSNCATTGGRVPVPSRSTSTSRIAPVGNWLELNGS